MRHTRTDHTELQSGVELEYKEKGQLITDSSHNSKVHIYLTLLMVVGCTSALGSEKSQYLAIVFGGGRDIHRK